MTDEIDVIQLALDGDAQRNAEAREAADVDRWQKRLKSARKYDEDARKQYAKDRRYARGDSGFLVDANIVGTNIDILESFLYARDPDIDVMPARACQPPSPEAIRDAAEETIGRSPDVATAGQVAAAAMRYSGASEQEALIAGQMAENAKMEEMIAAEVQSIQDRYARRLRDAKAFGETVEIVVSHLWRQANLKSRGRPMVRSGLTIGVGVLKASWQERTEPSPEAVSQINDLQRNLQEVSRLRAELEDASGTDYDEKAADLQRQIEVLQQQAERVVARGFVIDNVAGEDFQVAPGYTIANHLDAPWNAHRIPMLRSDAKAEFDLSEEQAGKATGYTARKPVMIRDRSANEVEADNAEAADSFETGRGNADDGGGDWVMVWEIWDRIGNHVLTYIEGLQRWVRAPWQPPATTRFYPFFLFTTSEVDGQRHPQSMVSRASKLVDEYNRIGTAEAEHRRRIKPKTLFLKGQIGGGDMVKIVGGETAEYVGVETTSPNVNLAQLFMPMQYPALDPALYDRSRINAEIERIFGVQEALAGAVNQPKTATEAQIQQGGFQARLGGRRDALESALQELAQYTAEVARAQLDGETVRQIAGPDALWPEYGGPDDLTSMVAIEIRAGSSGKPNTAAEREAWAHQLPMLQAMIGQIGQMRNSTPADVADCYANLLRITAERSGDRIDIDQLLPPPGPAPTPAPMPMDGAPPPGGMPPGEPPPEDPNLPPISNPAALAAL